MPSDPNENYKQLLKKEPQVGDKYVLIESKWFETWKRFLEDDADVQNLVAPGPLDFTHLIDPETQNHRDGVQLRQDAVEGNDFAFIPFELYEKLAQEYNETGRPIIREAIPSQTDGYSVVIETIFVQLRWCASRLKCKDAETIYRSRRTKVKDLKNELAKHFNIRTDSTYRLMATTDSFDEKWEPVGDSPDLVIADAGLVKNACLTYESASMSTYNTKVITPINTRYTPGLCGLSNLGNTCFMNSALQCISNVPALTEYFLSSTYKQHINRDNPLGMKGDVAIAYAELISQMWSGDTNYCAPRSLKSNVARYAPQFSGYNQQDSQEFMSFLLDGLHEDLNQVKKKPYIEKKDDDLKQSDDELAAEHWEYHVKRNLSKIQELFHGQIKSVVQCLQCKRSARTFDPICFLSLPLPGKKMKIRTFKIDYVRLDGKIKTYYVKCSEYERMLNLVRSFCKRFQKKETETRDDNEMEHENADSTNSEEKKEEEEEEPEEDFTADPDYDGHQPQPERILAVEIYSHRIYSQYRDDSPLDRILERDQIVFYETKNSMKEKDGETILMPCTLQVTERYPTNVALPFYICIPRNKCTGQNIQRALDETIPKFLPISEVEKNDQQSYTASLVMNYRYSQQTKSLKSMLTETIDFSQVNTSLTVNVPPSLVEKYEEKEREREKRQGPDRSTKSDDGVQTRSQKKEQSTTLADCLKLFTTKETLSDDDLWYCPNCKKLQKSTKKMALWKLPEILIIQLKRFTYTTYYRDKIDTLVDFPITGLNLSPFFDKSRETNNTTYDLIGVSNHMGGLGGGHYTAYAKNCRTKEWYTFDDGYVGSANPNQVISKSAYVLIYQRQESSMGQNNSK